MTSLKESIAIEEQFQLKTYKKFPFSIVRGEDVWVYTSEGEKYLDLYGGHAVVSTGHCHPHVVDALQKQASKLIFYSNLVYNDTRAKAAQELIKISPEGMSQAFFVNSGAEANDNAIKIARKCSGKSAFLSFEGSFHGRTMATLSATGIPKYRNAFSPVVPDHHFAPFGDLKAVEKMFDQHQIGGVLLETIQSMGGVKLADPEFYKGVRKLCDKHGALLIFDEVQTGMGRTGQYFFAPHHGVLPDLITSAKGIASGFPMGLVLVHDKYAKEIGYGDLGTTFGAGPMASAALLATIETIQKENLLSNIQEQGRYIREQLLQIDHVEAVLGLGFLIGIQFRDEASKFQKKLLEHKIITGTSGDPKVLRLLPPFTLKKPEIDMFLDALKKI